MNAVWTAISFANPALDYFAPGRKAEYAWLVSWIPSIPWWLWLIGFLGISLAIVLEGAYRAIERLEAGPTQWQRNAGEVEPFRERGISLTWQWQMPVEYPNATVDAENWRLEMVERLTRKFGGRAAGDFNNVTLQDFRAHQFQTATPYAGHIIRVEFLGRVIERIATGHYPALVAEPF